MTYTRIPDEEQMDKIMESDAKIQQQLALLMRDLSGPEKMALGLNAYFAIDRSPTQLCDLKPKHGEYSPEVQSGILLVQQLSPQAKAEFVVDLLTDDWEMGVIPGDAPSITIE